MRTPTASLLLFLSLCSPLLSINELPTVQSQLADMTVGQNTSIPAIDLGTHFSLPGVTNTVVQFQMNYGFSGAGLVNIQMAPASAPNTVINFLNYVNAGKYANTVIHRSIKKTATSNITIIQGGGYMLPGLTQVPTDPAIALEYSLPNKRGTIAMARQSAPDTATSEWFFNGLDSNELPFAPGGNSTDGYAAFGNVVGTGMTVVDTISALPTYGVSSFTDFPLADYTSGTVYVNNTVRVISAAVVAALPSTLSVEVISCASSGPASTSVTINNAPAGFGVGSKFLGTIVTSVTGNFVSLQTSADRTIVTTGNTGTFVPASKAGETSVVGYSLGNTNPDLISASINGSALELILKQNRGGFSTITVTATDSNGNTVQSRFRLTVTGSTIATAAPMDASNEGFPDLLFQNNAGQIYAWFLDGTGNSVDPIANTGRSAAKYLYAAGLGDFRLVARADVDNDGKSDLIFQNNIGQIYVWFLDGTGNTVDPATGAGRTGSKFLFNQGLGDFRIVACADVNSDGYPDLIFQNNAGQIYVWFLDGTGNTVNPAAGAGRLGFGFLFSGSLADWRVMACADVNSDGINDLIFQNNAGQIYVWFLDGTGRTVDPATGAGRTGAKFLYDQGLGDFRIVGSSRLDVNNDGKADLLFQNSSNQVYAWLLDGTGDAVNTSTGAGRLGYGYLYSGTLGDFRLH